MSSLEEVHEQTDDGDADEDDDGPVEAVDGDGVRVGPEGPEKGEGDVEQTRGVDGDTPFAQAPACRGKQLRVVDAAVEDAADGDGVGEHDGDGLQRGDGVKGGFGPEVDQRHQAHDDTRQHDGVGGDLALGVDLADPVGEGETPVAGEGPGLTRG